MLAVLCCCALPTVATARAASAPAPTDSPPRRATARAAAAGARAPPDAVLHVGPYKTASTTLEIAALQKHRLLLERLDDFFIPRGLPGAHARHKSHGNLADALRADRPTEQPAWRAFAGPAREAASRGRRLLLSSEGFCALQPRQAALLASSLRALGFGALRVVIVHRRLYDKLASLHSQAFMRADLPRVADYEPIADWLARNGTSVQARYGQTAALRAMYTSVGARVSILNLHAAAPEAAWAPPAEAAAVLSAPPAPVAPTPARASPSAAATPRALVAVYVCDHVRAARTCARLRAARGASGAAGARAANSRPRETAPLYDLVYAAAAARGLAVLRNARAVVGALRDRGLLARPAFGLELRCPSANVRQRLLDATLADERALAAPAELAPAELRALRDDFAEKAERALCSAAPAPRGAAVWAKQLDVAFGRASAEEEAAWGASGSGVARDGGRAGGDERASGDGVAGVGAAPRPLRP
ncbi:hypothetical protein KFE25_010405 [Diacronema lutheri]|uniref:Protein-tyrosine sulfotransferase n=1 Tax=Diacronema lutheri TaxID=2081491 RepID=A0A8J5XNQ6_DIALT|nr:hypothetical protein KFE25_010405 [Diacronema lutheri]